MTFTAFDLVSLIFMSTFLLLLVMTQYAQLLNTGTEDSNHPPSLPEEEEEHSWVFLNEERDNYPNEADFSPTGYVWCYWWFGTMEMVQYSVFKTLWTNKRYGRLAWKRVIPPPGPRLNSNRKEQT